MPHQHGSKRKRRQVDFNDVITAEILQDVFVEKILPTPKGNAKWKVPTDEALAELAGMLERWRGWYLVAQEAQNMNRLIAKAEKAVETLRATVPEIWRIRRLIRAEAYSPEVDYDSEAKSAELVLAFCREKRTIEHFLTLARPEDHVSNWHWMVTALSEPFTAAMSSSNNRFTFGVSPAGPFARFVAAVVPLVSGDKPSLQSVARRVMEY